MKTFSRVSFGNQFQFHIFTFWDVDQLFSFIAEPPNFSTTVRYLKVVDTALAASPPPETMTGDDVTGLRGDVTSQVEC